MDRFRKEDNVAKSKNRKPERGRSCRSGSDRLRLPSREQGFFWDESRRIGSTAD